MKPDLEAIKGRLTNRKHDRWGNHAFNDHAPSDISALLEWVEKLEAFRTVMKEIVFSLSAGFEPTTDEIQEAEDALAVLEEAP